MGGDHLPPRAWQPEQYDITSQASFQSPRPV